MELKEQIEHLFGADSSIVGIDKRSLHDPLLENGKRLALVLVDVLKPEHSIAFVRSLRHLIKGAHENLQTWGPNEDWANDVETAKTKNETATVRSLQENSKSGNETIKTP